MSLESALTYTIDQCTYYAAKTLEWVPGHLGNANQWLERAASLGYPETKTNPHVGDVAAYNNASVFGHVAVVEGVNLNAGTVTIGEENFTYGPGRYDQRTLPITAATGYIEPKGTSTSSETTAGTSPSGPGGSLPGPLSSLGSITEDVATRAVLVVFGLAVIVLGLIIAFGGSAVHVTTEQING